MVELPRILTTVADASALMGHTQATQSTNSTNTTPTASGVVTHYIDDADVTTRSNSTRFNTDTTSVNTRPEQSHNATTHEYPYNYMGEAAKDQETTQANSLDEASAGATSADAGNVICWPNNVTTTLSSRGEEQSDHYDTMMPDVNNDSATTDLSSYTTTIGAASEYSSNLLETIDSSSMSSLTDMSSIPSASTQVPLKHIPASSTIPQQVFRNETHTCTIFLPDTSIRTGEPCSGENCHGRPTPTDDGFNQTVLIVLAASMGTVTFVASAIAVCVACKRHQYCQSCRSFEYSVNSHGVTSVSKGIDLVPMGTPGKVDYTPTSTVIVTSNGIGKV